MTRKSATVAVCLLLAIALLGAATIGVLYRRQQSLPVYVVGELPPAGGYATNTLTLGDVTYVSGKAEFRLLPLHESLWPVWAIGRTTRTWQVYRPDGQPGQDYVYTSGEMMGETVYRDSRLTPLTVSDLHVREIRLAGREGPSQPRVSQDASLIREVLTSLASDRRAVLRPAYEGGDRSYRLELLSQQIPGLAYTVDTLIEKTGRVYYCMEPELSKDEWIPAGEMFTGWAR